MKTLIGLGHQMRSGKDTAADILVAERDFTRFAFADILREYAYRINPVILLTASDREALLTGQQSTPQSAPASDSERSPQSIAMSLAEVVDAVGWEKAKAVQGVRRMLQELGHHGREVIGSDVWVDALFNTAHTSGVERVVISDVRYDNEASRVRSEGGVTVHVHRHTESEKSDIASHPSEHGLTEGWADVDLDNNGSVDDLKVKVLELADSLI